ncbi:MAG: hypothetical protein ABIQ52_06525, partial [Vicinamibacterales bacterium]
MLKGVACVVLAGIVCATTAYAVQRPGAPRRELAVPFAAGETLTYDVSWSSSLTAGTATIRVG